MNMISPPERDDFMIPFLLNASKHIKATLPFTKRNDIYKIAFLIF